MELHRNGNMWNREERNKTNENWDMIETTFNNIVKEISDEIIDEVKDSVKLNWREPVETYEDLPANPEQGEIRMVRDTGKVYRYNQEEGWKEIYEINPSVINEVDQRLSGQINEININIENIENNLFDIEGNVENLEVQINDIDSQLTQLANEFNESRTLFVAKGSTQTIPNATVTFLTFNDIIPSDFAILDTNNRIKIIKPGVYDIRLNVHFATNGTGTRQIIVEGTDSVVNTRALDDLPTRLHGSYVMPVGNELLLSTSAYQNSGSNLDVILVRCSIQKVG